MRKISLLFVVVLFLACNKSKIVGNWQGSIATVNGSEINANVSNILMELHADGSYQYKATDNYMERGIYHVDGKFFFTTDTLNKKTEKMVEIHSLSATELVLKMQNLRKETELLTLVRK